MPTFFARRCVRGRPGRTERVVGGGLLVLLVLLVGVFLLTGGLLADTVNASRFLRGLKNWIGISEEPLFEGTVADGRARFADVEGLVTPGKIERYTDNLYEKIDGKESAYRSFLFVELRFAQYRDPQRDDLYDTYIFDQGEPANAFGIYAAERSPEPELLDLGCEAYVSDTSVYFWKGRYYVYVLGPPEGGDIVRGNSIRIAAAIADTIADPYQPFWAEAYLPDEDRVPHSFRYQATSALSYEFLERTFLADYETNGQSYQMYLLEAAGPAAAGDLFGKLAAAIENYDNVVSRQPCDGGEVLVGESLGVYGVAFHAGRFIGGVAECGDRALAERRAAALRTRLPGTGETP